MFIANWISTVGKKYWHSIPCKCYRKNSTSKVVEYEHLHLYSRQNCEQTQAVLFLWESTSNHNFSSNAFICLASFSKTGTSLKCFVPSTLLNSVLYMIKARPRGFDVNGYASWNKEARIGVSKTRNNIKIPHTLSREYQVVRNRYSRLLFTSEDHVCANLRVQGQSTNMML